MQEEDKQTKAIKKKRKEDASELKNGRINTYSGYLLIDQEILYLYDIETRTACQVPLGNIKQHGCDDFMIGSFYFLIGGYKLTKKTLSIDVENDYQEKNRMDMNVGRIYCTSSTVDYKNIHVLGGRDLHTHLSSCEKYSIEKDKWVMIKSLNTPRDCINSAVMDYRYIYAIEGRNHAGFNRLVERLDTFDEEEGWEMFYVYPQTLLRTAKSGCWCIQINSTELLIAGGTRTFDDRVFDDAWIFNTRTKEIKAHANKLPISAELYEPSVMYNGWYHQLNYCYDKPEYNLIQFSIITRDFKVIEAKDLWESEL